MNLVKEVLAERVRLHKNKGRLLNVDPWRARSGCGGSLALYWRQRVGLLQMESTCGLLIQPLQQNQLSRGCDLLKESNTLGSDVTPVRWDGLCFARGEAEAKQQRQGGREGGGGIAWELGGGEGHGPRPIGKVRTTLAQLPEANNLKMNVSAYSTNVMKLTQARLPTAFKLIGRSISFSSLHPFPYEDFLYQSNKFLSH